MRIRAFFFLASACLVAAGATIQACGGTTNSDGPVDSGPPEASTPADTGPKDSGVDAKDSAPPCDTNADFTSKIPDASLADGATTTGICMGCTKAKCSAQVDKCNKDCPCQGVIANAIECYSKNTSNPIACVGSFSGVPSSTQAIGLALLNCVRTECADECGAGAFDAGDGGDAGP